MYRTFSTLILALTAVFGLLAETGVAGLLPAESLVEQGTGGMGSSKSSQNNSFLESLTAFPVPIERLSVGDCSDTGMQTTPSNALSSVNPCTLIDCVEVRLVSLTTYQIFESRAILLVPFLDGIFRPPKAA